MRESGVSHVLEADLQDNHVWLFSTSERGCFGPAFTSGHLSFEKLVKRSISQS